MAIAEFHGKHGEEDNLTSDVFGAFKYLTPELGLLPFLSKAESFDQKESELRWEADTVIYSFWPRAGRREPDLFFLLEQNGRPQSAIVVEAKYSSGKHNLTVEYGGEQPESPLDVAPGTDAAVAKSDGDQLADYFCDLIRGTMRFPERRETALRKLPKNLREQSLITKEKLLKVPRDKRYLLYVTAHYALPQEDVEKTLQSLSRRKISRDRWRQLLWINWQKAAAVLNAHLSVELVQLSRSELEIAIDTCSLLDRKRLLPFGGWHSVELGPTLSETCFFWSPTRTFYSDIDVSECSRLALSPIRFFWSPKKTFYSDIEVPSLRLNQSTYFFDKTGVNNGHRT
jgi:hypothetical protein